MASGVGDYSEVTANSCTSRKDVKTTCLTDIGHGLYQPSYSQKSSLLLCTNKIGHFLTPPRERFVVYEVVSVFLLCL